MRDKLIFVDFTKNNKKNKKETLLWKLKNLLKKIFSSTNNSSDPDDNKKIINYNKDISWGAIYKHLFLLFVIKYI